MAVPTNARILRGAPLKVGVVLGISPSSDPTFDVELARATSSGVYDTIGRLSPKGSGIPVSFTDLLPDDNTTRLYKARAVKDGWEPGDYTSAVSAKPIPLPEIPPNITPLTGKGIGSILYVSTGTPVSVGTPAVAAYVNKTLRIAGSAFIPKTNALGYTYGDNGTLQTSSVSASTEFRFQARFAIPIGAMVTGALVVYSRNSTNTFFAVQVRSVSTVGSGTQQWQKASTGTGSNLVLQSSTFSYTAETSYTVMETALSASAAVGEATLVFAELTYKTQAYTDSL